VRGEILLFCLQKKDFFPFAPLNDGALFFHGEILVFRIHIAGIGPFALRGTSR